MLFRSFPSHEREVIRRVLVAQEQPNYEKLFNQQVQQTGEAPPPQPDPKVLELQMKGQMETQKMQMQSQMNQQKMELESRDKEQQMAMEHQRNKFHCLLVLANQSYQKTLKNHQHQSRSSLKDTFHLALKY